MHADEMTLKQWAEHHDVPYRTACQWRKDQKIPARRRTTKRTVTIEKSVTEYYVRSDVEPPNRAS